jgi:hypothetical protein
MFFKKVSRENVINNDDLFKELINRQIKNIKNDKKLQYTDLKRICKYIDSSIFDENECCLWNGYVTNANNWNKGTYVNFYFKKRKEALHRLLYINFVENLEIDEYLKFSCENKGRCCNIMHLKKFKYNKKSEHAKSVQQNKNLIKKSSKSVKIVSRQTATNIDLNKLHIIFD